MSTVLKIISLIIIVAGLYFGVYEGIIEPSQPGHSFGEGDKIQIAIGFALAFLGMLGLVVSQIADAVLPKSQQ